MGDKTFTTLKASRLPAPWKVMAEALVKHFGLHEGIWRVMLEFGAIGGMNAQFGPNQPVTPAAIVPVMGVSLKRVEVVDALSVDAAVVNPRDGAICDNCGLPWTEENTRCAGHGRAAAVVQ